MRLNIMVAGVLWAFGAAALTAGTTDAELKNPPAGWEFFVQPNRAYGILIPKKDRQLFEKEGSEKVDKFDIRYSGSECDIKDNVKVRVLALKFPVPKGETIDTRTVLEIFRDSYLKHFPGKLQESQKDINVGKLSGTEYRIDLDDGKQTRLRVFLLRSNATIAYQLSVTGTKAQVDGEVANRVLNSFRPAGTLKDIVGKFKK